MRMRTRLLMGFLLVASVGAILGLTGVYYIARIRQQAESTFTQNTKGIAYLLHLNSDFLHLELAIRDLADPSPTISDEQRQKNLSAISILRTNFGIDSKNYAGTMDNDTVKAQYAELLNRFKRYVSALEETSTALARSDYSAAHQILSGELTEASASVNEQIVSITDLNEAAATLSNKVSVAAAQQAQIVMLTFLILGIGLSVLLGLLLSTFLSRWFRTAADLTGRVSEGDLTARPPEKYLRQSDEIGRFANSINRMAEELSKNIGAVRSVGDKLNFGSREMGNQTTVATVAVSQIGNTVGELSADVEGQRRSLSETSEAVAKILKNLDVLNGLIEEQSGGVTETSASIEEMLSNIASITENVERLGQAFERLQTVSDDGKQKMRAMVDVVSRIEKQSFKLQEANTLIRSISGQTNLLAMNAAIEAAHAGDSGRGFAVVADEIRKLAELSSAQSKEISQDIRVIQDSITLASNSSSTAEQSFAVIFEQISELSGLERSITQAMDEQREGSRQLLDATGRIKSTTTGVRNGSVEMLGESKAIGAEMRELLSASEKVRSRITEILERTRRIGEVLSRVEEAGRENESLAEQLISEMDRFRVGGEE